MQKVKVQEVSLKRGTNEKGDWVFTQITGEDGAKFGSFHKGASAIEKGDLIELNPIVKGKNINFEEWNLIEKGPPQSGASTSTSSGNGKDYKRDTGGIKFEYELKAWMQNVDRVSIEGQVALKEIGWLMRTPEAIIACPDEMIELYFATCRALIARLTKETIKPPETIKEQPKAAVATGKGEPVDPNAPFPHIGSLLQWCNQRGIDKAKFLEIVGISDKEVPGVDVAAAYARIQQHIQAQKDPNDPEGIGWK